MKKKQQEIMWQPIFKKFLWWEIPNGWKDLGEVGKTYIGNETITYAGHALCRTRLHIGKVNNDLFFYFCPRCKIQVKKDNGSYLKES